MRAWVNNKIAKVFSLLLLIFVSYLPPPGNTCINPIKIDDGVCRGVIAYEVATGDIHIFEARAVTFATGGFGKIYKVSSNAHSLTGDGPGIF